MANAIGLKFFNSNGDHEPEQFFFSIWPIRNKTYKILSIMLPPKAPSFSPPLSKTKRKLKEVQEKNPGIYYCRILTSLLTNTSNKCHRHWTWPPNKIWTKAHPLSWPSETFFLTSHSSQMSQNPAESSSKPTNAKSRHRLTSQGAIILQGNKFKKLWKPM